MKRITTSLLLCLLTTTITVGPSVAQSPSPAVTLVDDGQPLEPAPLAEAVGFAPLGTGSILFTDWAAMKAAHGYGDITSATPFDERFHALFELTQMEAPFASFGLGRLRGHEESWG